MGLATDVKNAMLDELFGSMPMIPIVTIFIGLSTTAPTVTGGNVTEPAEGDYARVPKTNDPVNWPPCATTLNIKKNGTAITFPTATANWAAGDDLTHVVLYDADVAGTFLGYGLLGQAKPVLNGDTASFAIEALQISMPDA